MRKSCILYPREGNGGCTHVIRGRSRTPTNFRIPICKVGMKHAGFPTTRGKGTSYKCFRGSARDGGGKSE